MIATADIALKPQARGATEDLSLVILVVPLFPPGIPAGLHQPGFPYWLPFGHQFINYKAVLRPVFPDFSVPHGTRIRRTCRCSDGTQSVCDLRPLSAIRPLAVAATDNGLLAPGIGRPHRPRQEREVDRRRVPQVAHPPAGAGAPERAGPRDRQGAARPRHHRRAPRACAAPVRSGGRSPMGAVRADSRRPEATVAARHGNAPDVVGTVPAVSAVRTPAVAATHNGLLAPELAAGHRPCEEREVRAEFVTASCVRRSAQRGSCQAGA
jgi:hypothetical protein